MNSNVTRVVQMEQNSVRKSSILKRALLAVLATAFSLALCGLMIEGMARLGFQITHVYGLTEVYGPASVAVARPAWAARMARTSSSAETSLSR